MSSVKRDTGYDLIRSIAIFLVVCIHSNVAILGVGQASPFWCTIAVLQPLILTAVPLFFMVSGALLLSDKREESISDHLKKRVGKQLVPFLVWSVVYVVAKAVISGSGLKLSSFTGLIEEPAYYQFWFMYPLLGIYLLLPLIKPIVKNCDKKKIEYFLVLNFIFSYAVPVFSKYVLKAEVSPHIDLVLCEGYLGYFVLGYYLKEYHREVKLSKATALLLIGAVPTIAVAVRECYLVYQTGAGYMGHAYLTYMTPRFVLMCAGVFLLLQNKKYKLKEKSANALAIVSTLSIGVYYIHMLVLTVIEKIGFAGESNPLILVGKVVVTYLVSLFGAFVISKIPFVRKVLLGVK